MVKMPHTKDIILAYIETRERGATYADLYAGLGYHRSTLRRWIMELERDSLIDRSREHKRARAVFVARRNN